MPDIQEYTISFTNVDYPDLPIALPDPITDISGTVVTLPTMSGEYEDTYNYYTPESWSIGSFGEEIELSDNLTANLIFNVVPKVVTYTVSFENTTYPEFDVSIPNSIIVPEGDSITLPSVSGEYEDEEYTYTPLKWSIGEFGEVITPDSNLTADLVWNVDPIQTYNIIGGLISETESIDWLSLDVFGNMDVDNVNLYSNLYQFGTVCVDNITLIQDFYMLGKLMHDYDPAIEDASFVVYDTVEENIVSFYKEELVYSEIEGIVLNSPEIIIGIPQTVPNRSFFFTENGREEINNTSLEAGSTLPLYDESGNLITDEETITLYDNSQALSFMKENGNMEQALNSDLLVNNDGELSLQLSSQTRSRAVEQEETITIESTFGAEVTIPDGYKVDSVLCSRGYVFASSVSTSGTVVNYELPGEKLYFDSTNTSLIGVSVKPALQISVVYNLSGTVRATLSCNSGYSGKAPTSASADYVNSGGYFVKGKAVFGQTGDTTGTFVVSDMQTFPVYFNLSDSSGNWLYFCFRVPQTLWQFQNGVFSWLGNTTAMYDLAYWYNTRPVKINLSLRQVSREITAWSVQTERVFVLQFSNSEHPSLDIPMPSNETGHLGTVITLPTVTGEYTEEGMVYTPVAWNIGAFGDSYTLNNDVTAILQLSSRVALPTVTTSRLRISNDSYVHTLASGSEAYVYEYVDGSYRGVLYDDVTKKQCIYGWWNLNSGTYERYYYGVSAVRYSGSSNSLGAKNETADTISVYYILYAECSDPTAIVVTVTNSQEALYNSFKYTKDGTTYYYVLDGVQSQWTDDLSSIGYSEEQPGPALPTVYSYSGATQTESSIAPEASIDTGLTYDSGNLYLGETNDGQGNSTRYGWEAEEGPEYEEILMYLPGGETNKYYYQGGVTSSFSGNPGSGYLKTLYSDSELSIPATFDPTKRYEYGWYNNDGVWVVSSVQSVSDMPVSTVSSNGTIACIIYNDSGMAKLWFVSNYTSSSAYVTYSSSPVKIMARLYSL